MQLQFEQLTSITGLAVSAARPEPFLKWPGGKGAVLDQLMRHAPDLGQVRRYVEPFVGGGALFFHLAHLETGIEQFILNDVNADLVLAYRVVQSEVERLIEHLGQMEAAYLGLPEEGRRAMYLEVRAAYNARPASIGVERAAQLLFLNRTCYNGLYRVNQAGQFNVAFGRYENPVICNGPRLRAAHLALQRAELFAGDFALIRPWLKGAGAWAYLDPPYRPVSRTANFTQYSMDGFGPRDLERLATFAKAGVRAGAQVMVSNSDAGDGAVERLFGRSFTGHLIVAYRSISVKAESRGPTRELLLTSYSQPPKGVCTLTGVIR